jgi:hypothetical protein
MGLVDLAASVNSMPRVVPEIPDGERQALRATGTDDQKAAR